MEIQQEKCSACGRLGNAVCPKCNRMRCEDHIHIKEGKPFDAWCAGGDFRSCSGPIEETPGATQTSAESTTSAA